MQKVITVKYRQECSECKEQIAPGSRAYWYGKGKPIRHYPSCTINRPNVIPTEAKPLEETSFNFGEVRDTYLAATMGDVSRFSLTYNRDRVTRLKRDSWQDTWSGATIEQMKGWLDSGFPVASMSDINLSLMPDRKRRRLRFQDEGELQLDLALSGFDYPFIEWEKREKKPGMRVEIGVSFSAMVSEKTIAQYETWVARFLYTLEELGIDAEVLLVASSRSLANDVPLSKTYIRVKDENEAADFSMWSAIFSPGGFRHLVFTSWVMHMDRIGRHVSSALGYPNAPEWSVKWDAENRTLRISEFSQAESFPEAAMTEQLSVALDEAQGKS